MREDGIPDKCMGQIQLYNYNKHGKPLEFAQKPPYYPFDSKDEIVGQKYFARVVATDNRPYIPEDPKSPSYMRSQFVLRKRLGATVDGRYPVANDKKLEGQDVFYPGTSYNPPAPPLATAGPNERAADEMQ